MDSSELVRSLEEFARMKRIDRPTLMRILEDVFRTMIRKQFVTDENFDIIINAAKGDLEIWRNREVVEDDYDEYDENLHIRLSAAKKIEEDFEVGEEVPEELKLLDFGRRLVQTARQTLIQKIKDYEKELLFQKYKDQVGDLISAEVYQILSRGEIILVDADGKELSLPKDQQIPKDRFRKGDLVRAVIHKAVINNGNPKIILSRTSPEFLERLFESEVPEVEDGLIAIKKIVREPGERAKVAVESFDDRIDPVGACVGMKGARIHSIVRELENENIDVINYTDNLELYIARALSPAKVSNIKVDETTRRVSVFLEPEEVSKAIGRGGQNIKLASKLIDMEIDVFRDLEEHEQEEDVNLEEFKDEIEDWIIAELRRIGLDTAKSVLALTKDELLRRTDLEEETIEDVQNILRQEFEEEED